MLNFSSLYSENLRAEKHTKLYADFSRLYCKNLSDNSEFCAEGTLISSSVVSYLRLLGWTAWAQ